ncbi:helix-hairpin-helix domain-containing protein [Spirillospora sp. CA-108201]
MNLQCPAQATRRLMHWASRQAADMEGVGDVWIEKLAEDGVLRRRSDFYDLTTEQLLGYERMGEVSARNMVDSIASSKNVGLRRALIGLAIPMASEGTAKRLCLAGYERIEDVAAATADDLVAIRDIGPKAAESIVAFFARAEVREEIAALREGECPERWFLRQQGRDWTAPSIGSPAWATRHHRHAAARRVGAAGDSDQPPDAPPGRCRRPGDAGCLRR